MTTAPTNPPDESDAAAQTATPESQAAPSPEVSAKRKAVKRRRVIRGSIAVLGFVIGLIFGTYGEELIARSNPGFFGPDNQQIIDQQNANFADLEARLAELKHAAGNDPQAKALVEQVDTLVKKQKALSTRKDELFKETDAEAQKLKEQMLRQQGVSDRVDFWIKPGESMVLVDPDKVISITRVLSSGGRVEVNFQGERKTLAIGDQIKFDTTDGPRIVTYRQSRRELDQRFGFDLTRPSP